MHNFIFVAEGAFIAMESLITKLAPEAGLDPTAESETT
jgi:hypothetical protein